ANFVVKILRAGGTSRPCSGLDAMAQYPRWAGVGAGLADPSLGTKPGAFHCPKSLFLVEHDLTRKPGTHPASSAGQAFSGSCSPAAHALPTSRSSRCTISVRPEKPRIAGISADDRPLILAASSAS